MLLWCRAPLPKWAKGLSTRDGLPFTPVACQAFQVQNWIASIRHACTATRDDTAVDAVQHGTRNKDQLR
jgi:hypothetical protein